jgi:hypothetical protein
MLLFRHYPLDGFSGCRWNRPPENAFFRSGKRPLFSNRSQAFTRRLRQRPLSQGSNGATGGKRRHRSQSLNGPLRPGRQASAACHLSGDTFGCHSPDHAGRASRPAEYTSNTGETKLQRRLARRSAYERFADHFGQRPWLCCFPPCFMLPLSQKPRHALVVRELVPLRRAHQGLVGCYRREKLLLVFFNRLISAISVFLKDTPLDRGADPRKVFGRNREFYLQGFPSG